MPALAHADQSRQPDVVTLSRRAIDDPAQSTLAMGEMADEPMAGHADTDADAYSPDQPTPAADREKQHRPRQLLPHPGPLHESIEPVGGKPGLQPKFRRVSQHKPAMKLPPCVAPKARSMTGVVMTHRLALRPVAKVVQPDHAIWPGHSDESAEIDAKMPQPRAGTRSCCG